MPMQTAKEAAEAKTTTAVEATITMAATSLLAEATGRRPVLLGWSSALALGNAVHHATARERREGLEGVRPAARLVRCSVSALEAAAGPVAMAIDQERSIATGIKTLEAFASLARCSA